MTENKIFLSNVILMCQINTILQIAQLEKFMAIMGPTSIQPSKVPGHGLSHPRAKLTWVTKTTITFFSKGQILIF